MSSCEIGLLDYGFKISHISYRLVEARNLYLDVRVLRRPVIRPDVQLLRLAIVAEGGD